MVSRELFACKKIQFYFFQWSSEVGVYSIKLAKTSRLMSLNGVLTTLKYFMPLKFGEVHSWGVGGWYSTSNVHDKNETCFWKCFFSGWLHTSLVKFSRWRQIVTQNLYKWNVMQITWKNTFYKWNQLKGIDSINLCVLAYVRTTWRQEAVKMMGGGQCIIKGAM